VLLIKSNFNLLKIAETPAIDKAAEAHQYETDARAALALSVSKQNELQREVLQLKKLVGLPSNGHGNGNGNFYTN